MPDPEKKHLTEEEVIETLSKERETLDKKIEILEINFKASNGILKEELGKRILELQKISAQRVIYLMELEIERELEK